MKRIFFFLLPILVLSSCSRKIINVSPVDTEVNGLTQDFQEVDIVNILFVHGTGTQEINTFDEFANKMAEQSGFSPNAIKDIPVPSTNWLENLNLDTNSGLLNHGNIRISEYVKPGSNLQKNKYLRVYSVVWSGLTEKSKDWLDQLDSGDNRVQANKKLKSDINDKFVDMILYNSEFRGLIQLMASFAIGRTVAVNPFADEEDLVFDFNQNQKNILIGSSLGSKILWDLINNNGSEIMDFLQITNQNLFQDRNATLDFLYPTAHNNSGITGAGLLNNFHKKLDRIYLMSNQLPLLGLEALSPSTKYNSNEIEKSIYYDWWDLDKAGNSTKLIAFYEPNDVLGFRIPNSLESDKVINIEHFSAKWRFLFANPKNAHIGWKKNEKIIQLFSQGIGTDYARNRSSKIFKKKYCIN